MKKLIYITSAILLLIIAYFLYRKIKPEGHFTPYDFQPINRYINNPDSAKHNLTSKNAVSDTIIFIGRENTSWIGSLHLGKLYFRASAYIPYDKIPLDTNTVAFYTYLIEKSSLSIGDTIWSCLPEGYFITSVVDTLILYLNDYDSERNFIEYSAKPINLPRNLTWVQYNSVLIYTTPPIKNNYLILPEDSIYKNDSLLFEANTDSLYPRMSMSWVDTFRANLDEASKHYYPDSFKYSFTKEIKYYKFTSTITKNTFLTVDVSWIWNPSLIPCFGKLYLAQNIDGVINELWTKEWQSKAEVESHHIEIEGLYYDNAGHLVLMLTHSGWEWGYREVLLFDEQTNCFTIDDSYIDLY